MKIAHKFSSELNRTVTLGGVAYAFVQADPDDPASPHVAEVTDEDHIQRFLSITEGYRIYSDTTAARPAAATASTLQSTPLVEAQAVGAESAISTPAEVADVVVASGSQDAGIADQVSESVGQVSEAVELATDQVSEAAELTPEIKEAAVNLNGLSWQALKAQLNKGDIAQEVLKEALAIELRKAEVDRRETTMMILRQVIKD